MIPSYSRQASLEALLQTLHTQLQPSLASLEALLQMLHTQLQPSLASLEALLQMLHTQLQPSLADFRHPPRTPSSRRFGLKPASRTHSSSGGPTTDMMQSSITTA